MDVDVETSECLFGHGASKFLKGDKVAKWQREMNKGGGNMRESRESS